MSVTSPVETLAEGQTAEELVRLVTEPAHAGAVEQVQALGEGGHQHQERHEESCCHLDSVII